MYISFICIERYLLKRCICINHFLCIYRNIRVTTAFYRQCNFYSVKIGSNITPKKEQLALGFLFLLPTACKKYTARWAPTLCNKPFLLQLWYRHALHFFPFPPDWKEVLFLLFESLVNEICFFGNRFWIGTHKIIFFLIIF